MQCLVSTSKLVRWREARGEEGEEGEGCRLNCMKGESQGGGGVKTNSGVGDLQQVCHQVIRETTSCRVYPPFTFHSSLHPPPSNSSFILRLLFFFFFSSTSSLLSFLFFFSFLILLLFFFFSFFFSSSSFSSPLLLLLLLLLLSS